MKKVIVAKREKLKWLTALCLCLLCFSLCLSVLVRPTYADAPGTLDELERIAVSRWDDTNQGGHKDSFGETQGMAYSVGYNFYAAGTLCWVRYRLGGAYTILSGKLACADISSADAAMRLKIYVDNKAEPIYVSEPIRRDTRAFDFKVDVMGVSEIYMELVQIEGSADKPPEVPASKAFALLINPQLTRLLPGSGYRVPLKNVTLLDSTWSPIGFASNKDAKGNTHANSAKLGGTLDATGAMGAMGQARYQLDKRHYVFYGLLACAEDGAADAVMQVKFYADSAANPIYTSPLIKRGTGLVAFSVNVRDVSTLKIELTGTTDPKSPQAPLSGWVLLSNPYVEPVTPPDPTTTTGPTTAAPTTSLPPAPIYQPVAGWAGLYWQSSSFLPHINGYVYSFTRQPQTDPLLLRVYAKDLFPQVKAVGDITILKYFGSFNNADLVLTALKGISYPQVVQSVTLGGHAFTLPSTGDLLVHAQNRVYTLAEAFERSVLTNESIAAIAGLLGSASPALPTLTPEQALKIKEDILKGLEPEYYVNALQNNVYLRLKRDGTVDFGAANAAIWAGPDSVIGTADDKVLTLREGSFFYQESSGVWKFVVSRYDYEDIRWATLVPITTTAPVTSTTVGSGVSSTTNGFLTTGGTEGPPKTGVPLNAGLMVCVAALLMGCMYCGYRLFKKEKAKAD